MLVLTANWQTGRLETSPDRAESWSNLRNIINSSLIFTLKSNFEWQGKELIMIFNIHLSIWAYGKDKMHSIWIFVSRCSQWLCLRTFSWNYQDKFCMKVCCLSQISISTHSRVWKTYFIKTWRNIRINKRCVFPV